MCRIRSYNKCQCLKISNEMTQLNMLKKTSNKKTFLLSLYNSFAVGDLIKYF